MSKYKLVPVEIIDRFPEINPSNYNHDDACALNEWGVELVLAAADAPTSHRGDQKIVAQTEQVAAMLADRLFSSRLDDGFLYRESMHPKAMACWEAACIAQDILTETDVENAVAMLECEDDHEQPTNQPVEQQAPDVALIEALEEIAKWTERWTAPDHPITTVARKALAAYRNQGGEV